MRLENLRPLADVKAEVAAKIKKHYEMLVQGISPSGGIIYVDCPISNGITYRMNAGEVAANKMDGGVRISETLGEAAMVVRDFYNEDHPLTIELAREIRNAQAIDARRYWLRKCELAAQVDAATSAAELRAIAITFGEYAE